MILAYILEKSMCSWYSSKDLLSSKNNSTYSHYCKKAGNKTEYTLSDNSYS